MEKTKAQRATRLLNFNEIKAVRRRLINRRELLAMIPLSERTILDMEKANLFPKRFSISARAVAWDLQEVEEWIESRKAAAVKQPAPGTLASLLFPI